MKIFQKINTPNLSSSLIRVSEDTFAELIGVSGDLLLFKFTFKVFMKSGSRLAGDYDRVRVTVKNRDPLSLTSKVSANSLQQNLTRVQNPPPAALSLNSFKNILPKNGLLKPLYTPEISNKLYSGLKLISDIEKKEDFIDQIDVNLTSYFEDAFSYKFSLTELVSSNYKRNVYDLIDKNLEFKQLNSEPPPDNTTSIDPGDPIERINKELIDITQPITDSLFSKFTSETVLDSPNFKRQIVSSGRSPFEFDLIKYYLKDVPGNPAEKDMTWYQTRQVVKYVDNFDATCQMVINSRNKDQNLMVRFDLYKRGSNIIEETQTVNFSISSHYEAYNSITIAPEVRATSKVKSRVKEDKNAFDVEIVDREKPRKISKFNLYLKTISNKGNVGIYKKIGEVLNSSINHTSVVTNTDLSVLRVIPVDSNNQESTVFTNVILGPGYRSVGNLTIVASHFGTSDIRIDVFNVPKMATTLSLYRRDCTDNMDSEFSLIKNLRVQYKNTITSITDPDVNPLRVYEYYVTSTLIEEDKKNEIVQVSNFVMFRSYNGYTEDKSITVSLSGQKFTVGLAGDRTVSFNIRTSVSQTENEKITKSLKEQLGELYEQFLNPANNPGSPLGDEKGVPNYADLFLHEIVRTNLNTGERETFSLVTDGFFIDNSESRKNLGIKPINPQYAYHYQVFTYKKNPIEIFKKYVARGQDAKGREWFYLPYKWKNPMIRYGYLYPDDEQGLPVIDAYEGFTSEALGLTASYQVNGSASFSALTQVEAKRIDRNTVKISWKFEGTSTEKYSDLYDSFIVMKVVNGIRKFVGKTHKDYIYHDLTEEDLGNIYYVIVPIMIEFDIDSPGFSNSLMIYPEGLTQRERQPLERSGGRRSEDGKFII